MASIIYDYLTDGEKNDILVSRIRSNEYAIYNFEINKIEEASGGNNQTIISDLDLEIQKLKNKIDALKAEQATLILE